MSDPIMCFKAIVSFMSDLNEAFGSSQTPIKLMFKNIDQITFTNKVKIEDYNKLFQKFCTSNKEAILDQNSEELVCDRIAYSEKAYVDFKKLFKIATQDQTSYIWAHLLTILGIVDPSSRQKCSQSMAVVHSPELSELPADFNPLSHFGNEMEGDLISNMIKKIENEVNKSDASNPVELVSKIMQSGTFSEIVADLTASVERGDVDIGKLASGIGMAIPKEK